MLQVKCLVCGDPIKKLPDMKCDSCETPHHIECWESVGGCSTFGCENQANRTEIVPVENVREVKEKERIRNFLWVIAFTIGDVCGYGFNGLKSFGISLKNYLVTLGTGLFHISKFLIIWSITLPIYAVLGFLPKNLLLSRIEHPWLAKSIAGFVEVGLLACLVPYVAFCVEYLGKEEFVAAQFVGALLAITYIFLCGGRLVLSGLCTTMYGGYLLGILNLKDTECIEEFQSDESYDDKITWTFIDWIFAFLNYFLFNVIGLRVKDMLEISKNYFSEQYDRVLVYRTKPQLPEGG